MQTITSKILELYSKTNGFMEVKGLIQLIHDELFDKEAQMLIAAYAEGMRIGSDGYYDNTDVERTSIEWYVETYDKNYLFNLYKKLQQKL